jgi:predicted ATPase
LIATKGWAAAGVEKAYIRARELCQQVGEIPQLVRVLAGLFGSYLLRAEYEKARELAEHQLSLAQQLQDPILLLEAHERVSFFLFWPAEWISAREHAERALTFYDPRKHSSYISSSEADLGLWALSNLALLLWFLGYPDQAHQKIREALTLAQEFTHPYSLGWVLYCAAWLHQSCQESQPAQGRAEAVITLAREQGFQLWLGWGLTLQGWGLAAQGRGEEGIAQMHEGMATFRATGAELGRTHFLALLAEVYGHTGQNEKGLRALTEALDFVEKTGERIYEAELYRLRGELTLQRFQVLGSEFHVTDSRSPLPDVQGEAEVCFLKAIEVAQRQQAKSLELRATTNLARLWQQQGKQKEAHRLLAEIYGWFTEGFDTKDLREAQALLEELEGGR